VPAAFIIATMLSGNAALIVREAAASVAEWIDLLILLDTEIADDTESIVRDVIGPRRQREWIGDLTANLSPDHASARALRR
jgi:hypothetical protein